MVSIRVCGQRIAVKRNQFERLRHAVKPYLQRHEVLQRRIGYSPELFFPRLHLDDGRRALNLASDLVVNRQLIRTGHPGNQILLPNYEHALDKPGDLGANFIHALDDQGPRRAAVHLKLGEAVHVRMVPIQSRRLGGRNRHGILKSGQPG